MSNQKAERTAEKPIRDFVDFMFSSQKGKDPEKLNVEFMTIMSNLKTHLMEKYGLDNNTSEKLVEASMDVMFKLRKEIYEK